MGIVEKIADEMISPLRMRGIYQVFASLVAVLALGALFGKGAVHPPDTNSFQAFETLQGTPLAVLYRLLEFFSAPTSWIETIGAYVAASSLRSQTIGWIAALFGGAVSLMLVPDVHRDSLPSVQASTWWIAFATAIQTNIEQEFLINIPLIMGLWLVGLWIRYEWRSRVRGKGQNWRFTLDIVQLGVAALYFLVIFIPVIFSDHPDFQGDTNK